MHAHRHARTARLAVVLAALFALLLGLPATAHAVEPVAPPAPGTTAPAAVLSSVAPGGQAFRTAAHYLLDAPDSETAVAEGLTLGIPHAMIGYVDDGLASSALGGDELVAPTGAVEWLVVAHQTGERRGTFVLTNDGSVDTSGSSSDADATVEALPADALLLVAGTPVRQELYAVSDDRRTVTPLDGPAQATSGTEPMTATAFRSAHRAAYAAWIAESDGGVPEPPQHGTNVALLLSILGVAAAAAVVWTVRGRRRRHQPALDPAT